MIAESDRLMTRREAAAFRSLSVKTLEAWSAQGRGPKFVRMGSRVAYRQADLTRWIEEHVARTQG